MSKRANSELTKQELKKGVSLFRLARKNMRANAWLNLKMCFTFACLAFLFCLFTVYNTAINDKRDALANEYASSNYFDTQNESDADLFCEGRDVAFRDVIWLRNFNSYIYAHYGVGGRYLGDTTFFVLSVDGEQYRAHTKLSFTCIASPTEYFTQYDYRELLQRTGKTSFLSRGSLPVHADDVVIGAPMLRAYGLTEEDVYGKILTIYFKENHPQPGKELIFQCAVRISGILSDDFYGLSGHKTSNANHRPYFLFSMENAYMNQALIARYRMYLDGWPDEPTMASWKELPFKQSTTYLGTREAARLVTLDGVQTLSSRLYLIVGAALLVGLVLTVFLMIDKYMKLFSRSSGILMTLGMRRGQLYLLLGMQLLLICLLAIPIAIVLTAAGYYVINTLIRWLIAISLGVSLERIVGIFFLGIASVVLLSFVFFLYAAFKFRFKTIKDYLTTVVD